jgi:hypothetical protein
VAFLALGLHSWKKNLDTVDGPPETHADRPLPVLGRHFLDRAEYGDTGVVQDHMGGPKALPRGVGTTLDARPVAHVRRDPDGFHTLALEKAHGAVQSAAFDVRENHLGAFSAEGARDGQADAARAACDDRYPIPKISHGPFLEDHGERSGGAYARSRRLSTS